MNPFRPNPTGHVTEQDLLALHLNELPPARVRAVRHAVEQDPALRAESASVAAMLAAVSLGADTTDQPPPLGSSTLERNWQAIRYGLRSHSLPAPRWRMPAFAGALLAAAAGIVFVTYSHQPASSKPAPPNAMGQAARPDMSPVTNAPQAQPASPLREPGFRASFSSGIYHPRSLGAEAPIHLLGLASQPSLTQPSPDQVNPPADFSRQPAMTPSPMLRITPEPKPGRIVTTPKQDIPQISATSMPAASSGQTDVHLIQPHLSHPVDIMLGVGGTFVPEHDSLTAGTEPRTLAVTHAIVAIGSLHQQFRPALGYRVTLSYSRPELSYTYSAGSGRNGFSYSGAINTRVFDAAGTYVVQGPHYKRLTTSADVGAALLAFLPTNTADPTTSYGYRAAGVLGVNFDYRITRRIGARLGYRAKVYRSPNFRYSGGTIPVTTPLIIDNEPSLGVTYTFGKH